MNNLFKFIFVIFFTAGSGTLFAQGIGAGVIAFPSGDQSNEQISEDRLDCHNWAVSQTGFDPHKDYMPEPLPDAAPPANQGGSADRTTGENAARGAARGSVVGAVTGNPMTGVVIGSATSVLFGSKKRKEKEQEEREFYLQQKYQLAKQRHEAEQFIQAGTEKYRRAYIACMSSREYIVQ